jgi:hypothetical protein
MPADKLKAEQKKDYLQPGQILARLKHLVFADSEKKKFKT